MRVNSSYHISLLLLLLDGCLLRFLDADILLCAQTHMRQKNILHIENAAAKKMLERAHMRKRECIRRRKQQWQKRMHENTTLFYLSFIFFFFFCTKWSVDHRQMKTHLTICKTEHIQPISDPNVNHFFLVALYSLLPYRLQSIGLANAA